MAIFRNLFRNKNDYSIFQNTNFATDGAKNHASVGLLLARCSSNEPLGTRIWVPMIPQEDSEHSFGVLIFYTVLLGIV